MPTFGNRVTIGGLMTMRPRDDGSCFRHTTVHVEAKVFGIGALIEKTTRKEVQANYERAAAYLNRHG